MCNRISNATFVDPKDELTFRIGRRKLSQASSWKGRGVCALMVFGHMAGVVVKPLTYLFASCTGAYKPDEEQRKIRCHAIKWTLMGIGCSAVGQVIRAVRAFFGLFHPGCYFIHPLQKKYDKFPNPSPLYQPILNEALNLYPTLHDKIKIKKTLLVLEAELKNSAVSQLQIFVEEFAQLNSNEKKKFCEALMAMPFYERGNTMCVGGDSLFKFMVAIFRFTNNQKYDYEKLIALFRYHLYDVIPRHINMQPTEPYWYTAVCEKRDSECRKEKLVEFFKTHFGNRPDKTIQVTLDEIARYAPENAFAPIR